MIGLFAGYVVVSGLLIGYLIWAVLEVQNRGREDVDKLEKRLIFSMQPAVIVADSVDQEPPGEITYMDDERMAELEGH